MGILTHRHSVYQRVFRFSTDVHLCTLYKKHGLNSLLQHFKSLRCCQPNQPVVGNMVCRSAGQEGSKGQYLFYIQEIRRVAGSSYKGNHKQNSLNDKKQMNGWKDERMKGRSRWLYGHVTDESVNGWMSACKTRGSTKEWVRVRLTKKRTAQISQQIKNLLIFKCYNIN